MAKQRKQAVAHEVRRRLLSAYHCHDQVRDNFLFRETRSIDLSFHHGSDQPIAWTGSLLTHFGPKVGAEVFDAPQHPGIAIGIVLEIAEHLGKILRPGFQLHVRSEEHTSELQSPMYLV